MSPKEKAQQIYDSYENIGKVKFLLFPFEIQEFAIIAVDLAIEQFIDMFNSLKFAEQLVGNVEDSANYKFWMEVKKEILKIRAIEQ